MDNQHLTHAGIKGMKWGIRRFQNKDGSLTPEGKRRYGVDDDSDSHDEYKRARSTSVRKMSDAELKRALERVRMEEDYKRLTAVQKSAGRKWVESVLAEGGKELAKELIKKYGKASVTSAVDKGVATYKQMEKHDNIISGISKRSGKSSIKLEKRHADIMAALRKK